MWRYAAVLPGASPVTLGEGFTPLLLSRENPKLLIKNEGLNPGGSFEARGISLAVTMARGQGWRRLAIASTGSAAAALAAYAAAAGSQADIFMPRDAPQADRAACENHGARVTLVEGSIGDCVRLLGERRPAEGWLDLSAFQEPYGIEGKKTLAYEIAEQMGWSLPKAIVFPAGEGTGLIAMWKGFKEMEELGWLGPGNPRPRMVAVQAAGCAPIVRAWEQDRAAAEPWTSARTIAAGLRVPNPRASPTVLEVLRQSGGIAVAVSDGEIVDAWRHWARTEGLLAAPEGAAALAGYRKLVSRGFLSAEENTVLVNTGSGFEFIDTIAMENRSKTEPPASRQIGGIIQPY
jgi:threonine synthase